MRLECVYHDVKGVIFVLEFLCVAIEQGDAVCDTGLLSQRLAQFQERLHQVDADNFGFRKCLRQFNRHCAEAASGIEDFTSNKPRFVLLRSTAITANYLVRTNKG